MTEIDPICALQAAMEGYRVVTMDYACDKADIFVTATGNLHVINHDHMAKMKDQAIVCNIGHFDNEIDIASVEKYKWEEIKPQVDHVIFPDGKRIILLAKGRLVNLGCGTGHPSYVMSARPSPTRRIAQIELFTQHGEVPGRRLHAAQAPGREGRAPAAEEAERDADRADRRAGEIHRRAEVTVRTRRTTIGTDRPPHPRWSGRALPAAQGATRMFTCAGARWNPKRSTRALSASSSSRRRRRRAWRSCAPRARQLAQLKPRFFSVTYGAGGSTRDRTLETVLEIQRGRVSRPRRTSPASARRAPTSRETLELYQAHGIRHIVALRGDLPSGAASAGELRYANELVEFIRARTGDWFNIEVACYPEFHPQARSAGDDLRNFKRKVDAGANAAITQYFYNADAYFRFVDDCEALGIDRADRAGHHADRQLLAARALLGRLRRGDPALDPPEACRLRRRHRLDPQPSAWTW